jgi:hypothetical protein
MPMHIENDDLLMWIGETLEQMAQEQGLIVTKCPHCDCPVRFPLVARRSDIELFAALMTERPARGIRRAGRHPGVLRWHDARGFGTGGYGNGFERRKRYSCDCMHCG